MMALKLENDTETDFYKLLSDRCSYQGQVAGFYTYIGGVLTIPILLGKIKRYPLKLEHKLLIAGVTSLVGSYFCTKVTQTFCEKQSHGKLDVLLQT